MITLRQINYALAVSQTLHFKKAAEQCYVSASTLSNAITEMERQLGIKVFERNNKKVFITKLGKTFLEKAQNVKINVDDINQIQKIRSKNNVNWMNILKLAFKLDSHNASKIMKKINYDDKKISNLLKKLSK